MTADEIIAHLGLTPHPEGGWYRETWKGPGADRPCGTAIYFLLKAGEVSHWHRVDATEIWLYHAGAPLELRSAPGADGPVQRAILGPDLAAGHLPQVIIAAHDWQSARPLGDYTLVSCTVSPGFQFAGFELAPADFDIAG